MERSENPGGAHARYTVFPGLAPGLREQYLGIFCAAMRQRGTSKKTVIPANAGIRALDLYRLPHSRA